MLSSDVTLSVFQTTTIDSRNSRALAWHQEYQQPDESSVMISDDTGQPRCGVQLADLRIFEAARALRTEREWLLQCPAWTSAQRVRQDKGDGKQCGGAVEGGVGTLPKGAWPSACRSGIQDYKHPGRQKAELQALESFAFQGSGHRMAHKTMAQCRFLIFAIVTHCMPLHTSQATTCMHRMQ